MNRKGIEMGMLLQILLWTVILLVVAFFITKYIVGAGTQVPGEALLRP